MESRHRILIAGMTGMGKGNAAKALIRRERSNWPTIVIDPDDEHSVLGEERPGEVVLGCLPMRLTWEAFWDCWQDIIDLPDLGLAIIANGTGEETAAHLEDFANLIENTGGIFCVFDEVHRYARHSARTLNRMALQLRKRKVPMAFITPRATHVPYDARTQLTDVLTFCQREDGDVEALAERIGSELADQVPFLPVGESIYWNDSTPLQALQQPPRRKKK